MLTRNFKKLVGALIVSLVCTISSSVLYSADAKLSADEILKNG